MYIVHDIRFVNQDLPNGMNVELKDLVHLLTPVPPNWEIQLWNQKYSSPLGSRILDSVLGFLGQLLQQKLRWTPEWKRTGERENNKIIAGKYKINVHNISIRCIKLRYDGRFFFSFLREWRVEEYTEELDFSAFTRDSRSNPALLLLVLSWS